MGKKPKVLTLLILGIVLLTIIEWRPWHDWASGSDQQVAEVSKVLAQEKITDATDAPAIRAQLSPVRYAIVAAELNAKVQSIPFREGESFKRGQKLVSFECSTQQAQLGKATASMTIAERNYLTFKKLFDLGSAGRVEYENATSEYHKAKSDVDELTSLVSRCNIFAPFNGRIVEQKVRQDQFVQSSQPVLEILDQSSLELEFIVPSSWIGWLVPRYQFNIKMDETSKSYPARVTRVGAKIDSISQTVKIAAVIDGNFPELAPGMSGVLEISPPKD